MPGTDSAQGHRADEGRGNLCPTKHTKSTKSTKVSEHEAIDINFQSSCSSCPSWLLELSSVVKARSGECDCQLYRVLRAGRRTRCPSYMGRADVGLSRPAGRSWRPTCTTDILSVAAGAGIRHRVAIAVWRPGRRLGLGKAGKVPGTLRCPKSILSKPRKLPALRILPGRSFINRHQSVPGTNSRATRACGLRRRGGSSPCLERLSDDRSSLGDKRVAPKAISAWH